MSAWTPWSEIIPSMWKAESLVFACFAAASRSLFLKKALDLMDLSILRRGWLIIRPAPMVR